jgi:hypothetical protein
VKALAAFAAAFTVAILTGCSGIEAPDLFIVHRTGSGPSANLTLLVNEEGGVRCNGGRKLQLSDPQIVKARAIQEEIKEQSAEHLTLAPRRGSVLHYFLRDEAGWVRFSDNSRNQPAVFRQLALFVLQSAQQVCHLPE